MTRAIVHRTPGLLDPQAITVMGLSAKPNSTSPIGQFGTGLKYALATLIRLGAEPRIFIGRDEYVFYKKPGSFRGQELERIFMRRRRFGLTGWHRTELPFTTNYGRFWKPWMAFRELEANTRDEGGETFLANDEPDTGHEKVVFLCDANLAMDDHTTIIVDCPEYVEAWEKRDEIFLPVADMVHRAATPQMVVLEGVSDHAYYRTLRALDLPKPSLVTWCLLAETGLTEDRFIADWSLRYWAGHTVVKSDDEDFIEQVMTAGDEYWESDVTLPDHVEPSPAFRRVVARRPQGLHRGAYGYVSRHTPYEYSGSPAHVLHARPWGLDEAGEALLDVHGTEVALRPEKIEVQVWRSLMLHVLGAINRPDDELPEEMPASMRLAYNDKFGVAPGSEAWTLAGIPDADSMWSALRMASRTHPVDDGPSPEVAALIEADVGSSRPDPEEDSLDIPF